MTTKEFGEHQTNDADKYAIDENGIKHTIDEITINSLWFRWVISPGANMKQVDGYNVFTLNDPLDIKPHKIYEN